MEDFYTYFSILYGYGITNTKTGLKYYEIEATIGEIGSGIRNHQGELFWEYLLGKNSS